MPIACSKQKKDACIAAAPECEWKVGKGCRRGQDAPPPTREAPRPRAPPCYKKKKQSCIDSPDCDWIKGSGCKKKVTNQRAQSPPRPPPRRAQSPSRPRGQPSQPDVTVDPTKFYCTKPFNRATATIKQRVASCEQGKLPHTNYRHMVFKNKQQCIEQCHFA